MTIAFLVFATSTVLALGVEFVVTIVEVEKLQSSGHMVKESGPVLWVSSAVDLFTIDLSQVPTDVRSKILSARKSVGSILKVSCVLAVISFVLIVLAFSQ